ncbi:MAG: hypothetical protein HY900_34695 [Deltaproteobacteria bacterium]|nr:hypothetical protein [Deltaproteobacteria bacterium]
MTENGRGALSDDHPLALGALGGRAVLPLADVVLVVGSRFVESLTPSASWSSEQTKFIHLNADPKDMGPPRTPEITLVCDAGLGLEALAAGVHRRSGSREGSTEWTPYIKDGSIRLLVTHGERRMAAFPKVPTAIELGYNYNSATVFLIAAPKGTPPEIVTKLDGAFRKALADPEVQQAFHKMEVEVSYRNSADTLKFLRDSYVSIGEMVEELKIPREGGQKK